MIGKRKQATAMNISKKTITKKKRQESSSTYMVPKWRRESKKVGFSYSRPYKYIDGQE